MGAIDEKKLLRLLDSAYRSGGYLLVCGDRGVELVREDAWRCGLNYDRVTAKIKAKFVEHMDFLPAAGSAWMVRPDGAQSMEQSAALMTAGAWIAEKELPMLQTSLTWGPLTIYQNEDTGRCAAIPTPWAALVGETGIRADLARGICFAEGEGESASCACVSHWSEAETEDRVKLRAVLTALEKVKLVGAKAAEELAGQTDLLEEPAEDGEDADDAEE